jgi:hypothetical protein
MWVKNSMASSDLTLQIGRALIHFDCHEQVCEAPERFSQWSHHVEPPHSERPGEGDGLMRLRQEVRLPSVELATFAASHNALGVSDCCGPIEALPKCASDDCSGGRMVAIGPRMDVLQ